MHAPGISVHVSSQRAVVVPHIPHATVEVVPGTQPCSPVHGPYSQTSDDVQKRCIVPHIPQRTLSIAPAEGHVATVHAPTGLYVHVSSQSCSCVCPGGQPTPSRVLVPGAQTPSPAQAPVTSHAHAVVQRADCVPQLPHATSPIVPGAQTPSPSHAP